MTEDEITPEDVVDEEPSQQPVGEARARLRYVEPAGPTDRVFELTDDNLIGRYDPAVCEPQVDLTEFPDSKFVSRRHARIRHEGDVWLLTDLGSGNGTFLYDEPNSQPARIVEEMELRDGMEIAFGSVRCRFELVTAPPES